MMHFSKIYTRTPIIHYHIHTLHTHIHIHNSHTRSSTYRWAHRYKTVDRYDPTPLNGGRPEICLWFPFVLSACACMRACLRVCVCACEWILFLPAAVAAAAALIAPTQCCPLFGGLLLLCLDALLTLAALLDTTNIVRKLE